MKLAVSALGPNLDDKVDERFGRAAYLLIVDADTLAVDVLDNSANKHALQGAGLGAAEAVSAASADAVITGHLGPKAFRALDAIDVHGYSGVGMTVREAIGAFAMNTLEPLDDSNPYQRFE
ncbi:MAG: NifB/NifX family molybdenum-iron cluster-binding protein [Coriobacteriia bacterium]|nr:NifB/NifX family molybdenum-iron cluster-binding protein [Coriobacteriia bacterium]